MIKIFIVSILIFALMITTTFPPGARLANARTQQQEEDDERLVVGTTEVVLDAVVKDKKGHVVKNLQPSDFEVYEDGVRQDVRSFRLITREAGATTQPTTPTADAGNKIEAPVSQTIARERPPANTNRISAVALVFDRLSTDARVRAREAALSYLGNEVRPDDFIGVFGIDLSLKAVQSFTNNTRLLRQAIDRVIAHSPSTYAATTGQQAGLAQKQATLQSQMDTIGAGLAGTGESTQGSTGSMGATAAEQQFAEMTRRAVEGFEILERGQQGFATTDGLLSIIHSMGRLPGRKALILFSEGLAIPTAVEARFRSVISAANRANVSIYAVDAAGLRVTSSDAEAGRAMTALGQRRAAVASSPFDGSGPMSRDLERNEDLLRLNPESGLGQLAKETGGLFINSTNSPGTRLRQVDEDLHSYYLLTYSPQNQNFDGRFRQISLKVNRPGVEVQARKGYYAINSSYDMPLLGYEAPALALLSGKSQPNSFDSRVAAFSFPEPSKVGLVPVMVQVPAGSINFVTSSEKKAYATNFSVVVLIKDEAQHVVRKLSNQYILGGPLENLETAQKGKILFYRETELAPGRYTVVSVVYDATTSRASINSSSLIVPGADQSRLRLSSIVIIENAERLGPAAQGTSSPFRFNEVLIYPNIGEPTSKSITKELAFFVTVYPAQGATVPPKLKLQILKGSRSLAEVARELPAPDHTGRIQFASAIPIDKFPPGDYELRVTAQDAQSTAISTERFTVSP